MTARCPGCGHTCCPYPGMECGGDSDAVLRCERDRLAAALADRDAQVTRVRALHRPGTPDLHGEPCVECGREWPCPTSRALDGAGDEHDCATCTDCIHDGRKCCGCYDGACCRDGAGDAPTEPAVSLEVPTDAPTNVAGDEPRPGDVWREGPDGLMWGPVIPAPLAAEPTGDEPPTEPRCPPGLHRWSSGCDGHPERPL